MANFDHVKDLPFIELNAKVECLLGSTHIASWFVGEPVIGRKNEPIGLNTNFGWTTAGVAGNGGNDPALVAFLSTKEGKLKEQLERLFTNDFPVIKDDKKEHSKEARFALEQLAELAKWDLKLKKYSCGLPYKDGREEAAIKLNLVDSRKTAVRRMQSLKRSLEKVPEKKDLKK